MYIMYPGIIMGFREDVRLCKCFHCDSVFDIAAAECTTPQGTTDMSLHDHGTFCSREVIFVQTNNNHLKRHAASVIFQFFQSIAH